MAEHSFIIVFKKTFELHDFNTVLYFFPSFVIRFFDGSDWETY